MKRVTLRVRADCPDDIPAHVLTWMAENMREYVGNEFGPLVGDVRVHIGVGASPELIASTASTGCAGLGRGDGRQLAK